MATLEEHQLQAAQRYYKKKAEQDQQKKKAPEQEAMAETAKPVPSEKRARFINELDTLAIERVQGSNDLVAVNYFELGLQAARAVCRIQIRDAMGYGKGYGTGFLVAPNLLLTNNHVLDKPDMAIKSFAEFNFEDDINFLPKPTKLFTLLPGELFYTDSNLDFTLVAVSPSATDGTTLDNFGALKLIEETGKALPDEYLSIIQHPLGNAKQVAVRENELLWFDDNWVHYSTDTQPGSSGSPVFNDQWFVVALHHSGVPKKDSSGRIVKKNGEVVWVANEGVRISRIYNALNEASAQGDAHAAAASAKLRAAVTASSFGPILPPQLPIITPAPNAMVVEALPEEWYQGAEGYQQDFLNASGSSGSDYIVSLPAITAPFKDDVVELHDGGTVLNYRHFSIVMNKRRRLAFYTAVNIDGNQSRSVTRSKDKWYFDGRFDRNLQCGPELYEANPLDRGHLVRRLDPCWGSEAVKAGEDTFHFTNCAPQHADLNQKTWNDLEDYILGTADRNNIRVSVFTGPVFREDDLLYRGQFQIPADFWKVIAFVNRDGSLTATAYLQTQKNLIGDLEFFGPYKTYQVAVLQIEALTGLDFGRLRDCDPMNSVNVAESVMPKRLRARLLGKMTDALL